jgi:hypothetical protein
MLFHDRGQFWRIYGQNCPRSWSSPGMSQLDVET